MTATKRKARFDEVTRIFEQLYKRVLEEFPESFNSDLDFKPTKRELIAEVGDIEDSDFRYAHHLGNIDAPVIAYVWSYAAHEVTKIHQGASDGDIENMFAEHMSVVILEDGEICDAAPPLEEGDIFP